MPYTDFTANLLDIKDLIVENLEIFTSEIHIYFHLKRRDLVCPAYGAVTNKVHDHPPYGNKRLAHKSSKRHASGKAQIF